ncbi:hypothetical protein FKW77_009852 [Venturia effusa]|uniref:tRNA-intron lyase n=1 Tax=Venturia effusa TaxID=50376 RepID=A0A517L0D5_9PEZI|nr:hypothetical protein FKW77_009852 [Venturia effusa]
MITSKEPEIEQSKTTSGIAAEDPQATRAAEAKDDMNGAARSSAHAAESRSTQPKRPNYHKLHARPMPLSVYPIPNFFPHNPLSLFRIAYFVLRDWVFPPSSHTIMYSGYLSAATQSVHVTDPATVRALWEMGFFGTGSLSRSEPNWLDLERRRLGLVAFMTAEEVTAARRNVRMEFKRERARLEREALEEQKRKEAAGATGLPSPPEDETRDASVNMPVESDDLSAAEDVQLDLLRSKEPSVEEFKAKKPQVDNARSMEAQSEVPRGAKSEVGEPQADEARAPNASAMQAGQSNLQHVYPHIVTLPQFSREQPSEREEIHGETHEPSLRHVYSHMASMPRARCELPTKIKEKHDSAQETSEDEDVRDAAIPKELIRAVKMRDCVQRSLSDEELQGSSPLDDPIKIFDKQDNSRKSMEEIGTHDVQSEKSINEKEPQLSLAEAVPTEDEDVEADPEPGEPVNQEHLQLSMVETFYLSYALGALKVVDSASQNVIDDNRTLLQHFRQMSYFPPASAEQLKPDDPFLLSYVVYHHFRSLGWVVREGIKFAVDFLLYERGPVFTHATFAIMIVPSYTDAYWRAKPERAKEVEKKRARKSWHWLHCANRVQGQVIKTLVLVYVDVPAPVKGDESEKDIVKMLQRYKIREFALRRWSPNRNRE